jgi:hypothetical protein
MKRDRPCFVCKTVVRNRRRVDCQVRCGRLGWSKAKHVHSDCFLKRIHQARANARKSARNFHARQRRRLIRAA